LPAFSIHGAELGVGYCGEFGREGVILETSVGVANVLLVSEPGSRGGAPVSPARGKPPLGSIGRTVLPLGSVQNEG
jgi:hypothetical protein